MVKLYVASFGYRDIIQQILKYNSLDQYFSDILTPSSFIDRYGNSYEDGIAMDDKNQMIQETITNNDFSNPLLIDDSRHNIIVAKNNGYNVFKVDARDALTDMDADIILNIINECKIDVIFIDADNTLFVEHVTSEYVYKLIEQNKLNEFDPSLVHIASGFFKLLDALKNI